jgi:hypothetical protein
MAKAFQIARNDAGELFVPRIRRRLEAADLRGARDLLAEARRCGASESELDRLEEFLAPPRPRMIPFRDRDRSAEIRWLKEHAREYRGQWVALLESELLGHGQDFEALTKHLDSVDPEHAAILHFVE